MTLKLIHFPNTRSLRVAWALFELDVEADIDTRPFNPEALKSPDYLALNPLGKTPVFVDGDQPIVESTAIIEYVARKFADGRFTRSPGDADFADYLQWLHYGEAGLGGYVNQLIAHSFLLPEAMRSSRLRDWARDEMSKGIDFIDAGLSGDFLLGEFSLADISVVYPLLLMKFAKSDDLFTEKVAAYFERATMREAYRRASALRPPG